MLGKDRFESDMTDQGGVVTKSPCKNCPRRDLPKEYCVADCRILEAIRDIEIATTASYVCSRPDYAENVSCALPVSIARNAAFSWML